MRFRTEPGALLVLLAALCWGTTGTAQAFAPLSASSLSVGAMRLVVGGAALVLFAGRQKLWPCWRQLPPAVTLGAAAAVAAYQLCFFAGVRRTGVTVGTIVAIGSAPVIAGALVWLTSGNWPGRRWTVATAMAVMGCTLLVGSGSDVTVDATGVALAVGAGASYAIYTQFSARIVGRVPPDLAAAAAFGLGALLLLPVLALTDQSWLRSARGLAVALELGLVATALAYVLYTRALTVLAASTAVTLALAEPVVASILGVAILGERLTLAAWAGAAMIAAGLLLLTLQRSTAYEP